MTTTSPDLCQAPHRHPTRSNPGRTLCPRHTHRITELVDQIRDLWPHAVQPTRGGTPNPSSPGTGCPLDLDRLIATDPRARHTPGSPVVPAAAWIRQWADTIADQRHWRHPLTQPGRLNLITQDPDWNTTHDWAPQLLDDLTLIVRTLTRLAGETRHRIAHCQAPHPTRPDADCGGPLLQDRDGSAAVTCARCGDRWTDHDIHTELATTGGQRLGIKPTGTLQRLGTLLTHIDEPTPT